MPVIDRQPDIDVARSAKVEGMAVGAVQHVPTFRAQQHDGLGRAVALFTQNH
jgi:hypothetical protein